MFYTLLEATAGANGQTGAGLAGWGSIIWIV